MSDRHTASSINDDALTALYDQRDQARRWAVALEQELAAAEAANIRFRERVQAAADEARGSMRDWLLDALSDSPDPREPGTAHTGRARAEAERERLRARLGSALACVRLLRIYADGLDHGRQVDGSDVAHRIRRILTGLDDRPTGDPEPQLIPELERAEAKVAEYENAITWHTDCLSCARVLDSCVRETHRAERAEAELARLTEAESADAAAGSYAHRAEHAEAARDQHAGLVRRAEAYLAATHQHTARHDVLGENSSCAGCELLDHIRTALAAAAEEQPAVHPLTAPLARAAAAVARAAATQQDDLALAPTRHRGDHPMATPAEELRAAEERVRMGDRRIDIDLRGPIAALLDTAAEHLDTCEWLNSQARNNPGATRVMPNPLATDALAVARAINIPGAPR